MDLDERFEELKRYSNEKEIEKLNKKIYNLNLSDDYLKSLNGSLLVYIHVKLHNAMSYKKPFAPKDKIKIVHDRIAKLMTKHTEIDNLDKISKI